MSTSTWQRYQDNLCVLPNLGFRLDISRMHFADSFLSDMEAPMQRAFDAMAALEAGAIANPDEKRQVGHYWLRSPALAPESARRETVETLAQVKDIAARVHSGALAPPAGGRFRHVLVIGIGGSALGPQFVGAALRTPADPIRMHFLDNTDPDGMDLVLKELGPELGSTLALVISKSGGTKETRNGMVEAQAAWRAAGLDFARHAIAITGRGSQLDGVAEREGWLVRVPMFDYVGGRTSQFSAVGLLPAALQGIDIDAMIAGAAAMDAATRNRSTRENPAALLALMWHHATRGRGERDMVVLPYKDRLELFSKYLQQLVMESLGKELDLAGRVVNQGIAVYGNKGSTDQHAYVQQLREGVNNFFVVFVEVLRDRAGASMEVDPQVTSGDYLFGFLHGTRDALTEKGRESMTITVAEVSPAAVGQLIALFERAVGFYATLVNINAYHQPGVEAGKRAAGEVLDVQRRLLAALAAEPTARRTAGEWAAALGDAALAERAWMILEHLAANDRGVARTGTGRPADVRFGRG
ncbi:MAG: glucose-6-phosphate isomerase [Candidatus Sumerlaeia bacterium]|nr:glucose-6-phosphate isomerase [Candidatus Sumerlaeia bacterium]